MEYFTQQYGSESYEPVLPDWYGGGYLDNDRPDNIARLCVVLVENVDTPELRQEIVDALGSDHVDFISGKYSLNHLHKLQENIMDYPAIQEVFAGSGVDEEENRTYLELTEVSDEILELLTGLDPDDDAIYVTVGQRAAIDVEAIENLSALKVAPADSSVDMEAVEKLSALKVAPAESQETSPSAWDNRGTLCFEQAATHVGLHPPL